jgi:hypothetical protein
VIFCVDIRSSWTSRQRKRWHSQQSGFNCFAFSRRTMPGLPEIRMNPSPQKLNGELPCPQVSGHDVPDGRARVRRSPPSPGQSAAGLGLTARSSAFANLRRADRCSSFCRAPSNWICGTARSICMLIANIEAPGPGKSNSGHGLRSSSPKSLPQMPARARGGARPASESHRRVGLHADRRWPALLGCPQNPRPITIQGSERFCEVLPSSVTSYSRPRAAR